jgi:hypothetical protein
MRHCPECRHSYPGAVDLCPRCWVHLAPGPPQAPNRLALVFETGQMFEADLVEAALRDEGIPCLRSPGQAAVAWPFGGALTQGGVRFFVPEDLAALAAEVVSEVAGDRAPRG